MLKRGGWRLRGQGSGQEALRHRAVAPRILWEPWWLGWRRWRGRGGKNERKGKEHAKEEREGGKGKHRGQDPVASRKQLRIASLLHAAVFW